MTTKTSRLAPTTAPSLTHSLGFWSAAAVTAGGIIYFLAILVGMLVGDFTFPPAVWLQIFGGVSSLLFCPVLVLVAASLHQAAPVEKKSLSLACLGFTLLFAAAVSINRFTQLGVVRQSQALGENPAGIGWFLAYGDRSVMLGLEMMGWGWFLGLALLCAAPLFAGGRLESWIRWLMVLYGVMGLVSAVGFLLASPLSLIGFAAWGVVLPVVTGLLAAYFRREGRLR